MIVTMSRSASWSDGRRLYEVIGDRPSIQALWEILHRDENVRELQVRLLIGDKVDPECGSYDHLESARPS